MEYYRAWEEKKEYHIKGKKRMILLDLMYF